MALIFFFLLEDIFLSLNMLVKFLFNRKLQKSYTSKIHSYKILSYFLNNYEMLLKNSYYTVDL